MDQCRSIYDINSEVDMSLKFTGPGRPGFVLERHFVDLGVKERTLFLKEDLEDTQEEEELDGMEDEQLQQRRKEEETHALVLAMKREWGVWLDVLPFPPALDQFEPGVYTMISSSLNPGILRGGMDFAQLREEFYYFKLLDFVEAPKVLQMYLPTLYRHVQLQVIKLTLSPRSVELTELSTTVKPRFGQGRLSKKVPKPLLGQMVP